MRAARLAAVVALVACQLLWSSSARAADGGWTILAFDADIEIQADGRLHVVETLDVDFGLLERHGIFRDIPVRYAWPAERRKERVYDLRVASVTDARGKAWKYETQSNGANIEIKIGDADRTVTGRQTYRIDYTVRGALNSFSDHDELYWNVTGADWPSPIVRSSATVRAPAVFTQTTCFVGAAGSTARCAIERLAQGTRFTTGRPLIPGEQLTVVTALRKGVVPEPAPILEDRPREFEEFFDLTPLWLALAAFVAVGGLVLVFWRWYSVGRDERDRETIVPEFEPPDRLRPAQIGLLIDERADTLDVTATIVDLAVRGHHTIAEIPKEGLLGSRDWLLTRTDAPGSLLPYERTIFDGLFSTGAQVRLSALRRHFYVTLAKAQRELYADSVARGWFAVDPSRVRTIYAAAGVGLVLLAGALTMGLGYLAGGGIVGLAGVVPAIAVIAISPRMPRKTRDGAELARRALGFQRYMEVAETDRQRFAEREQIFAEYLPYAIVFRCVDRWAKAFEGIDLKAATSGWYAGTSLNAFSAMNMSRDLSAFSHEIGTAIASTPGGSGSSGFGGGGGAGGGGGGGGGGSW